MFGGAKLVLRKGRAFLYVSVKLNSPDFAFDERKVVGIDRGIINTAVTYDGKKTRFYKGTEVKQKRAKFKAVRQSLQKRNTPSSRRRLKAIGKRENRYVSDVNHQLAKTLVYLCSGRPLRCEECELQGEKERPLCKCVMALL